MAENVISSLSFYLDLLATGFCSILVLMSIKIDFVVNVVKANKTWQSKTICITL